MNRKPWTRHLLFASLLSESMCTLVQAANSTPISTSNNISTNTSATTISTHQTVNFLFCDEWERYLSENPESATGNGDQRYNDRWTDLSLPAIH